MDNFTLNRVELRGRIGQDPRIANVGESAVARFSIATSEIFKDRNGDLKEEITCHNETARKGRNIAEIQANKLSIMENVSADSGLHS